MRAGWVPGGASPAAWAGSQAGKRPPVGRRRTASRAASSCRPATRAGTYPGVRHVDLRLDGVAGGGGEF